MIDFAANSDDATFTAEFENHFNLNNAINYWLYADIACATDSMINNFTVATWDGQKWYMCWYDLDIIFGLMGSGGGIHPNAPDTDLLELQYTVNNPIWAKLYRCFYGKIRERYWKMREGIANPTVLVNHFRTFQNKWGADNISKEREKWSGRPNGASDVDNMYAWMTERFAVLDDKYSAMSLVVKYTITNNLTDVKNSNDATIIVENETYVAQLSPISTSYTLDSVSVTMGGVDVTSYVYADGSINIAAVTGNVVITATARQNGASLGYTPLKYIASNGTQTLYTDIGITENTRIVADYQPLEVSGDMYFGVTNNYRAFLTNNSIYFDSPGGRKMINDPSLTHNVFTRHLQEIGNDYLTITSAEGLYEPITKTGTKYDASKVPSGKLMLFGTNKAKLKIYSFTVYEGEEKVLELIPALVDGSAGLYDLVTNKFYTNTAGEDPYRWVGLAPEGDYAQVQYIKSDGTQRLHTGVNASDTLKIVADITAGTDIQDQYFGTVDSAETEDFRLVSVAGYINWHLGSSLINPQFLAKSEDFYGHRSVFEVGNNYLKLTSQESLYDEQTATGAVQSSDAIAQNEIVIIGNKGQKVHSFTIYDGETKVRDFIPATVNGWAGLYDLVEGKFYYHDEENGENEYTYA
jgi:hypothetical protein